jgi:hypothetical protein
MAVDTQDILDLGFVPGMFHVSAAQDLESLIAGVITDQSAILAGRIGQATYGEAQSPLADYVRRAEICLCAAEMCSRRINKLLAAAHPNGDQLETQPIERQKKAYLDEAENLIDMIEAAAQVGDYSGGVVVTQGDGLIAPDRTAPDRMAP